MRYIAGYLFLIWFLACGTDLKENVDALHPPLGLKVVSVSDYRVIISFYSSKNENPEFTGFLIFKGSSEEEVLAKYKVSESINPVDDLPNVSVSPDDISPNSLIEIEIINDDVHSPTKKYFVQNPKEKITSGDYIMVRAYSDRTVGDTEDEILRNRVSPPSNVVRIP